MSLAKYTINATPGDTTVTVNGEPVVARQIFFEATPDGIPRITLVQGTTASIEGEGIVQVATEQTDLEAVKEWLHSVNPEALEAECQKRIQAGRRDPYRVALEVLIEGAESV